MIKKFFKFKTNRQNYFNERQFLFFGLNYIVGFGFIATISGVILTGAWGMLVFSLTSLITLAVLLSFSRAGNKYKILLVHLMHIRNKLLVDQWAFSKVEISLFKFLYLLQQYHFSSRLFLPRLILLMKSFIQ